MTDFSKLETYVSVNFTIPTLESVVNGIMNTPPLERKELLANKFKMVTVGLDFTGSVIKASYIEALEALTNCFDPGAHRLRWVKHAPLSLRTYREWHKTYALVMFRVRLLEFIETLRSNDIVVKEMEAIFHFILRDLLSRNGNKDLSANLRLGVTERSNPPTVVCLKRGAKPPTVLEPLDIADGFVYSHPTGAYHGSCVLVPRELDTHGEWSPIPATSWGRCDHWYKKWLLGWYGLYVGVFDETWPHGRRKTDSKYRQLYIYKFELRPEGGVYVLQPRN